MFGKALPNGTGGVIDDGGIFPSPRGSNLRALITDDTGTPEFISPELLTAESNDDTSGSGIFDDRNNVHPNDGIFATQYALPGFVAREPGWGPSEVIDWQTQQPISSIATGLLTMQQNMVSGAPKYPLRAGWDAPNYALDVDDIDFRSGASLPSAPDFNAMRFEPGRPVNRAPVMTGPQIPNFGVRGVLTANPAPQGRQVTGTPRAALQRQTDAAAYTQTAPRLPMVDPYGKVFSSQVSRNPSMDGLGGTSSSGGSSWVPWLVSGALVGVTLAIFSGTLGITGK